MSITTLIVILLIVLFLGGGWGWHAGHIGSGPVSIVGVAIIIFLVLFLTRHV